MDEEEGPAGAGGPEPDEDVAASGRSRPSAARMPANRRTASSECPPSSKKLSCTPMRSISSTSDQIAASASSVEVRGPA